MSPKNNCKGPQIKHHIKKYIIEMQWILKFKYIVHKYRFTDQLEGLIFAIIVVFEFPPKESWKRNNMDQTIFVLQNSYLLANSKNYLKLTNLVLFIHEMPLTLIWLLLILHISETNPLLETRNKPWCFSKFMLVNELLS